MRPARNRTGENGQKETKKITHQSSEENMFPFFAAKFDRFKNNERF